MTLSAAPAPGTILVSASVPGLVRAGLEVVLRPYADRVRILAEAGGPDPHVEIFDLHATGVGRGVRRVAVPRIALTWQRGPEIVARARRAGAVAVLPLSVTAEQLVASVELAHRHTTARVRLPSSGNDLSPREAAIVELICRGSSNVEIADHLFLSINSVKTYIRSAYRKMGVERRSQAVIWGLEHGFAPLAVRWPDAPPPAQALSPDG